MHAPRRTSPAFALLAALTIAPYAQTPTQAPALKPAGRLVVLVVVDQMRHDYFERYADRFTDGFKRISEGGAVFKEANYSYASTKTAQAHALLLSGWSPSGTGMIGDVWYDRRTGANVTAGASTNHKLLGSTSNGGSPEQMLVHTVGDSLKQQRPRSKIFTASWKQYSAILTGGQHPDAAYWYDVASGRMVTSDYYMREYPEWVKQFNETDRTRPFFGTTWLTHTLGTGTTPNAAFRNAFGNTPYSNDLVLAFAQALLEHSAVGVDADPDIVAISFSGLDLVGHQYGPESPEVDATMEAQDRQLGELLRTLDARVGPGNYTVALTADHGAPLTPEKQLARGVDAGRLNTQTFRANVEKAVTAKLEITGPVIAATSLPELYLNYGMAAVQGVSKPTLDRAVVEAIEAQPGIARAYTTDDIASAAGSSDAFLKAVAAGYYADRSGDIHVLVKPNYMFLAGAGVNHGTPYDYDTHVPFILYGAGIKPGKHTEYTRLNELAPTIGRLLGINYKGDPQSRVLTEALQ